MKIIFDETNEYQLKHPTTGELLEDSKGKPMTVELYGKHTSVYKNAVNQSFKRRTAKKDMSNDEIRQENDKLLAACVKGFKNLNIEYADGKFLDPNDVISCFENAFWIRDQVDSAIVDLENFIQTPSKS